jgi:hypothetical protein
MKKLRKKISDWAVKTPKNKVSRFLKYALLVILGSPIIAIDYLIYVLDRIICSFIPTMTLPRYTTWSKELDWKIYALIRLFVVLVVLRFIF